MNPDIVGILLAAGQGTRFGADKRLYPLKDGTPMAVASARALRSALAEVVAVVDNAQSEVARLLGREGVRIVVNARAREGMGTSIACGVAAGGTARGWLIALADMPHIPTSVICAVVERLAQGADIVAPVYQGTRGHPVGFSPRHAQALMQLSGDEGARGIITRHAATLELIEVTEKGVVTDIDAPMIGGTD